MRRTICSALVCSFAATLIPVTSAQAATTSTTTVIEAPNQFGVDSNMPIRVQVTADQGAAAPTGVVRIYDSSGAYVDRFPLTPTDLGRYSWVEFTWSSSSLGRTGLKAVFDSDSTNFTFSQSTYAGIQILQNTPLSVLRMPDRFVVGDQANLLLIITPGNQGGSATFNVNNVQIYPSTRNTSGQIPFPWTPTEPIIYTFVSNYSNATGTAGQQMRQSVMTFLE